MKNRYIVLSSLPIALLVWGVFTAPLIRHVGEGIPSSSTNVEKGRVRRMIMGDHLQLLYNYWVFTDMLLGKTPMWHNIYVFNTGDDAERKYVGMDLFPFSLVFTVGYVLGNRAFGWNLLGFFSIWMSYLLLWLLVRRYTRENLASALAALLVIFLPYRWASLLGGSPTGLAMVLIPLLFLGLDMAVRDRSLWGGFWAGFALLFASWNDGHVFFFGTLAAPCWCVLAYLRKEPSTWFSPREWGRVILALLPFVLIAGAPSLIATLTVKGGATEGTSIADGRSMREVGLFSPRAWGLWAGMSGGHENSIFVGVILPALLVAGLAVLLWKVARKPSAHWADAVILLLLLLGSAVIIMLALGVNGPQDGRALNIVRKRIPHYDMIRQPAKIYAILPPLLALAAGLAMAHIRSFFTGRWRVPSGAALVVLAIFMGANYSRQVRTTVCLLDEQQGAYAAIAEDARQASRDARILVIPLWPGDSAWTSLYEHYVSLYRIRMLNGYLPVVPLDYKELTGFHGYANVGIFTPETWNDLRERGIDYLVFHENAFPEQVSNFPAAFTLYSLLTHPRLDLLAHDGSIWAFKMRDDDRPAHEIPELAGWDLFPATHNGFREAEWGMRDDAIETVEAPRAFGGRAVALNPDERLVFGDMPHCGAPGAALLLRLRGTGTLRTDMVLDQRLTNQVDLVLDSGEWVWRQLPVEPLHDTRMLAPAFQTVEGRIEIDAFISFAGRIPDLAPGESWNIPAPLFFRAGYTDLGNNSVRLRTDYESDGGRHGIFYGPKLPLPPGEYDVILHYATEAPDGTPLGSFYLNQGVENSTDYPVIAGQPAVAPWINNDAQTINVPFTYSRKADMEIRSVEFRRTR